MHFKKILGTAVALAVASTFALTGCGEDSKTLVRMSHSQIETHPDHIGLVAFKNYVESKLPEKYEVQIFPNATLGANEKVLELIKQGSVQYLVVSTANIEAFDPIYSLFSMPYLFTSEAAFEKFILDGKIMEQLGVNSDKNGFYPVAAFTAGSRNFYAKTPIRTVADLSGKKFRVQAGPTNVAMMNAFGGAATPMSFGEVYSALQQSVIDGAENNELALTDQKHGEVCKYYTYDMHQMVPDLLVVSKKFYDGLSADDKAVFDQAAAEAEKAEFEAWDKAVQDAKKTAEGMGVEFITVDVNEFRNKVLPLHEELLNATPALRPLYEEANKANQAQ
ncbi:MAG: TRAP transporter substrate-binding protein [Proteobacteria bacterium]|uniref:TRAP transporter substrate-binding protein n=1 Tax=Candidatus Avisuccinivibrio stercorigallinarum TaxID=2840704 RepID=A0A9D9GR66_9GAMM|nr:TRAP transporter substrate-binding protein [Candidatus Avisuccinivibrio stercorigallinarum]